MYKISDQYSSKLVTKNNKSLRKGQGTKEAEETQWLNVMWYLR